MKKGNRWNFGKSIRKINNVLLAVLVLVVIFNSFQIYQLGNSSNRNAITAKIAGSSALARSSSLDSLDVIPKGVPAIYGEELSVSFDDVSSNNQQTTDATIRKFAILDKDITLEGENLNRYINVLYKLENGISCEYCCGARAVIFDNGEPACGCAHSYAMRGLAKHLITKHSSKYTDEQLLGEIGKWKTLFFPTQITEKAKILQGQGIELNYINLASNKYRGVEEGVSGGMVGGC